jgi:hypothetical protein
VGRIVFAAQSQPINSSKSKVPITETTIEPRQPILFEKRKNKAGLLSGSSGSE